MDYLHVLEQLSGSTAGNSDAEFSIARALSLPIEFLVSFVRNRKESELLINISKSAESLDCLIKYYESVALRSQELQEAWDALWLSQEPFVIPTIPIIGHEMLGLTRARSILLEKIANEIQHLEELGKLLNHYMDVNYSLVEELHMEGVDRLAISKLLLVEVESEIMRRITYICSNESIRDLSPMTQFLFHLRRKHSIPLLKLDLPNYSGTHADTMTDGSSKTQNRIENFGSEDRDTNSPECQSFCSKCAAPDWHYKLFSSSNTGLTRMLIPTDILAQEECLLGLSLREIKDAHAQNLSIAGSLHKGGTVKDFRNQSSSASEERLPSKGPDTFLHVNVKNGQKQPGIPDAIAFRHFEKQIPHHDHAEASKSQGTEEDKVNRVDSLVFQVQIKNHHKKRSLETSHAASDFMDEMGLLKEKNAKRILVQKVSDSENSAILSRKEEPKVTKDGENVVILKSIEMPKNVQSYLAAGDLSDKQVETEQKETFGGSETEKAWLPHHCDRETDDIVTDSVYPTESNPLTHGKCQGPVHSISQMFLGDKQAETLLNGAFGESEKETSLLPCNCGQQTYDTVENSLNSIESNTLPQSKCKSFVHAICQTFDQQIDVNGTGALSSHDHREGNEIPEPLDIQMPESPILATQ